MLRTRFYLRSLPAALFGNKVRLIERPIAPDQPVYLCLVPPTSFIINLPTNAVRSVSPPFIVSLSSYRTSRVVVATNA
jgi:hypothetical protein